MSENSLVRLAFEIFFVDVRRFHILFVALDGTQGRSFLAFMGVLATASLLASIGLISPGSVKQDTLLASQPPSAAPSAQTVPVSAPFSLNWTLLLSHQKSSHSAICRLHEAEYAQIHTNDGLRSTCFWC